MLPYNQMRNAAILGQYYANRRLRRVKRYGKYGMAVATVPTAYSLAMKKWYPSAKQLVSAKKSLRQRPRKLYIKPKSKGLKKQVKALKRLAEADTGTHLYRWREAGIIKTNGPKESQFSASTNFEINSVSKLEAALSNLRYYDPSNPGVLLTASGLTGTFHKEFLFKRVYNKLMVRNNYQVPCTVTLYIFKVKESTSITPETAFANGLADIGGVSASSPLVFPTDSQELLDLYKIEKSVTKLLQPGQQMMCSTSAKSFQLDPSFLDDHTSAFQKRHDAGMFGVRIVGPLGHDTVSSGQQGILQCSIDYLVDSVYEIQYSAGADIKTIEIVDGSISAFTNNGVVSNKSVSDNQTYSVS